MKRLLFGILIVLVPTLVLAQEEPAPNYRFEFGAGTIFGEEAQTFDTDNLRVSFKMRGLNFNVPTALDTAEVGVIAEAGYVNGVLWELWQTNRTWKGNIVMGSDLKIAQGAGENAEFNFDARIVSGYRFAPRWTGYLYLLEENKPIAFQVAYQF